MSDSNSSETAPASQPETNAWIKKLGTAIGEKVLVGLIVGLLLAIPYWAILRNFGDKLAGITLSQEVPVGTIVAYWPDSHGSPPTGWEICDGTEVKTQGSDIKGVLKPNLVGRFPRGAAIGLTREKLKDSNGGAAETHITLEHLPYKMEQAQVGNLPDRAFGVGVSDPKRVPNPLQILPPYQDVIWIIRVR